MQPIRKLCTVFLLMSLIAQPVFGGSCKALFSEGSAYNWLPRDFVEKYPRLARFTSEKYLKKASKNRKLEWKGLENAIVTSKLGYRRINIDNALFNFIAEVEVTKNSLELNLINFRAAEKNSQSMNELLDYGERSTKNNMHFFNLLATLFSSIDKIVKQRPELKIVKIKGEQVVNKYLEKTLKEMGFDPTKRYHSIRVMRMSTAIVSTTMISVLWAAIFREPGFIGNGGLVFLGSLGGSLYELVTPSRRDWELEIALEN